MCRDDGRGGLGAVSALLHHHDDDVLRIVGRRERCEPGGRLEPGALGRPRLARDGVLRQREPRERAGGRAAHRYRAQGACGCTAAPPGSRAAACSDRRSASRGGGGGPRCGRRRAGGRAARRSRWRRRRSPSGVGVDEGVARADRQQDVAARGSATRTGRARVGRPRSARPGSGRRLSPGRSTPVGRVEAHACRSRWNGSLFAAERVLRATGPRTRSRTRSTPCRTRCCSDSAIAIGARSTGDQLVNGVSRLTSVGA